MPTWHYRCGPELLAEKRSADRLKAVLLNGLFYLGSVTYERDSAEETGS